MKIHTHVYQFLFLILLLFVNLNAFAAGSLTSSVTMTTGYWNTVSIKFTNNSGAPIDLRNAVILFDTPAQINNIYGDYSAISYPTIALTSTLFSPNNFHNVVSLSFAAGSWVNSQVAVNKSITMQFGFSSQTNAMGQPILPTMSSIKNISVTLANGTPTNNGNLIIKTPASPGSDVTNQLVPVTIIGPGLNKVVNINWSSQQQLSDLTYGSYTVSSANVGQYVAPANQQANINSASAVTVTLGTYAKPAPTYATVNITLPVAPVAQAPAPAVFMQNMTDGTAAQALISSWGITNSIKTLTPGNTYKVWANNFSMNGNNYVPNYTQASPFTFVANATTPAAISLSYVSTPLPVNYTVAISVSGLPSNAAAVAVTLRGSSGNVYTPNVAASTPVNLSVLADSYIVTAANYTDSNNKFYTANPQTVIVNSAGVSIAVNYIAQAAGSNAKFAPYIDLTLNVVWSNASNSLIPVDLGQLGTASGVKNFTLAFIVSGGSCTPSWGGYYPVGNFGLQSINNLRAAGGDVIISFGGAAGQELAQTCTDVASLVNAYKSVITTYNVTKLDFDIEGAAQLDHAANIRRAQALAQLQTQYPNLQISFTLPVLPTGLVGDGLGVLQDSIGNNNPGPHPNVAYINIMAMDYGGGSIDMGAAAINAAKATASQLRTFYPGKSDAQLLMLVGVTPMIGVNDVTTEVFTLQNATALNNFAKQNQLPLVSMWSFNRDNQCPSGAVTYTQITCSSILQSTYAFSLELMK